MEPKSKTREEEKKAQARKKEFKKTQNESIVHEREEYASKLRKKRFNELLEEKRKFQLQQEFTLRDKEEMKKQKEDLVEFLRDYDIDLISPFLTEADKITKVAQYLSKPVTDQKLLRALMFVTRKALAAEIDAPVSHAVNLGFIPKLVELLRDFSDVEVRSEIAWCITNIAGGLEEYTKMIRKTGVQYFFVELLRAAPQKLKEHSLWALGNIIGNDVETRDQMVNTELLDRLWEIFTSADAPSSILGISCWVFSNLARGKPAPPLEKFGKLLPLLKGLENYKNEGVVTDTFWAISYLTDGHKGDMGKLIEYIDLAAIIKNVTNPNVMTRSPALRSIGNICAGNSLEAVERVLSLGTIDSLQQLLKNESAIKSHREVCWVLSNIAAGPATHLELFLTSEIFPLLVKTAHAHSDQMVRKEAAWAVTNVCHGVSEFQAVKAVEYGALEVLAEFLPVQDIDLQAMILLSLEHMFECGQSIDVDNHFVAKFESIGGLRALEQMQLHPNVAIYKKVADIFQKYIAYQETTLSGIEQAPMIMEDADKSSNGHDSY